jgi:16S rRNA (guanine966-N2)-methyltransferase
MYIIAGRYRGRKIKTTNDYKYRPTTYKVKEAIFSILASGQFLDQNNQSVLKNAVTIDVFGGTGALTFEALSRGTSKGFIIEKDSKHLSLIKENIINLGFDQQVIALQGDARNLMSSKASCDIAFIDPPFNQGVITDTIKSLINKGWIKDNGFIVIERHEKDLYQINDDCQLVFARKYGRVLLEILQKLKTVEKHESS